MTQIKISVVVPTYKRQELLQSCLKQLVNQSLDKQQYEIIVVTDGPDRQSQTVISQYTNPGVNIRLLSLPAKKGPAAARNLGWRNAKGNLVAFTDDDCLPEKNWLFQILSNYQNEAEIAYTGKVIVPVSVEPTDYELNTKGLETGDFVTANCVVTKTTMEAVGGFDEAFATAWREDSDLEFKLLERKVPIIKIEDAIVVHPVRKVPWGVSIKEQKKTKYNALLFKKYPRLYRQRIRSTPSWNYYFIILCFLLFTICSFLQITWFALAGFFGWILLTANFIVKRLSASRKTVSHILEMIVTSMVIPFLSVYWTLYGSVKYRVLFF